MSISGDLLQAARAGDVEGINTALANGAQIDATDARGYTALHHAAETCQADAIKALLAAGANKNIENSEGAAPWEIASKHGDIDSVQLLLTAKSLRGLKYILDESVAKKAAAETERAEKKHVRSIFDRHSGGETPTAQAIISRRKEVSQRTNERLDRKIKIKQAHKGPSDDDLTTSGGGSGRGGH